jgi:hypothetical protein
MSTKQAQDLSHEEKIRRLSLESLKKESQANASPALESGVMRKLQADPKTLAPNQVLQLQRLVGNRAVQRVLASHRKTPAAPVTVSAAPPQVQMLSVDGADTEFEDEADQISEAIVQGKRLDVQRKSLRFADVQRSVQRNMAGGIGPEGGELDAGLERQIKGASGGGSLPGAVRNTLEPKLGVDLSNVQVHTGAKSASLNRQLNAKAFTYKNNIFDGGGQSPSDLSLTAHEVVHTMHQGAVRKKSLSPEDEG